MALPAKSAPKVPLQLQEMSLEIVLSVFHHRPPQERLQQVLKVVDVLYPQKKPVMEGALDAVPLNTL